MKVVLALVFAAFALLGQSIDYPGNAGGEELASDWNVNSRYTIESINFADHRDYKLSASALDDIQRLIGAKVNTEALDRLAQRLRSDLRAHDVTFKIARGAAPEEVRVLIHVDGAAGVVDASVPKFVFNSQQGLSGVGEIRASSGPNELTFRMLRDSDTLIEKFSGIQARYDRFSLAGGRIRLGFEFDAYEDQYDPATLTAIDASHPSSLGASLPAGLGAGAYGSRLNYEPSATFVLAVPLTFTTGLGFEQLNSLPSAARPVSANAVINTLRYLQRWNGAGGNKQELDAGYSLRAATTLLGSGLAYTRHVAHARYSYARDAQSVEVTIVAGAISGQAPLFERFALGDSAMLRGWNKYDLDPLGGNRLAYGSVTYGYHIMRVFYDAGSVWDQGSAVAVKQSAGIGVSGGLGVFEKGAFLLAIAFPFRQDRVTPVLIAGMNF
ncbi:MAG TPA: BamA/TamA family outer membrane protein [Bryobacteraceae bacterium]|nr:BamA/TamA family outer membrane protein [Bryobacteraceae bacterium]